MSNETASTWTPDLVRQHCAAAARLEMWTIPLYLCVAYSIKNPDNPDKPITLPQALAAVSKAQLTSLSDSAAVRAKLSSDGGLLAKFAFYSILSVAIQEMLHAELAANLCNAVGGTVDFTGTDGNLAPVYDAAHVPCVKVPSDLAPLVKLGPLNSDSIKLLQWIEHYDTGTTPPPDGPLDKYDSIGDFYHALEHGVDQLWTELYPQTGAPTPDDLKQKDDWQTQVGGQTVEEYSFSVTISGASDDARKQADTAIQAIVGQGEGRGANNPVFVNPSFQMKEGNRVEIVLDTLTHWERFTIIKEILDAGGVIETWEAVTPPPDPDLLAGLQRALSESLSSFLDSLNAGFGSTNPLNLDAMSGIGSRMYEVWQNAGLPDLSYQVYTEPTYPHACQGLNACSGQGVGGSGTGPGDGDCATAWFHTCGGTNKCSDQGGCGYAVTSNPEDFTDNWIPNQNGCQAKGGCGVPIPDAQVFNTVAKYGAAPANFPDGDQCAGASVWARARKIFEAQHSNAKPAPPANALRTSLNPTAK